MKKEKDLKVSIKYPSKINKNIITMGIDLSLSRTGYSISYTDKLGISEKLDIGSIKPADSSDPIWVRSILIGKSLLDKLKNIIKDYDKENTIIILVVETPTPMNDFLTSLNRLVTSILFQEDSILYDYEVYTLSVNASTLRSAMGLVQRGSGNKKENIERAYNFISRDMFPGLDSDACDGVLLDQMGIYASYIFLGFYEKVPKNITKILCEDKLVTKGNGNNQKSFIKGIIHNETYWYSYSKKDRILSIKDAKIPSGKKLDKVLYKV